MSKNKRKQKINIFEFFPLLITALFLLFFISNVNSEHGGLKEDIKISTQKESGNNDKIEEKEIFKRMEGYWFRLSTVGSLTEYKDSIVNWYQFLLELRENIPTDATVNALNYSNETGKLSMQIITPSEERLLQTMKEIEDFEWLIWLEFNTINKEKITFLWDKTQYTWFATTITTYLDEKYLQEKYDVIRNYKRLKYDIWDSENVMDLTREVLDDLYDASFTGEVLLLENTWSTEEN